MHHATKISAVVLGGLATLFAASGVSATAITDPTGDFIAEYLGPERGDLDVLSIEVIQTSLAFVLTGRMAADIDPASGASYVWGVNRGAGIARFGDAYSGILFDTVIVAQAAGTAAFNLFDGAGNQALDPAAISIMGDSVTLTIAKSLLPSTGFDFNQYGFNLWPRAAAMGGIGQLADFAPDNDLLVATPEPATLSLAGLALAGLLLTQRRRSVLKTHALKV
jgi:hypothetical protein